jgi:transcriptional regulator with XRE-family HTH domain
MGAGISGAQLARRLNVTRSAVSFQLAGRAAVTNPELLEAIADLGGSDLADTVAGLIDQTRAKADA